MKHSDVFVSYSRKNSDFRDTLVKALQNDGREVWLDLTDIAPGVEDYRDDINEGIEGADTFIAILSPFFFPSQPCMAELSYAVQLKKRIIPVVYEKFENVKPPDSIAYINWIFFCEHAGKQNPFDEAFASLQAALNEDYRHIRRHTQYLQRAKIWDKNEQNSSFLLRGLEISQAEHWLGDDAARTEPEKPLATELHVRYIQTSRHHETQRQRQLLTGVSVALVVTIVLALATLLLYREANIQRGIALDNEAKAVRSAAESQSLALASGSTLARFSHDTDLALTLALQANQIDAPPTLAQSALIQAAYAPGTRRIYSGLDDDILSAALSPDGRYILGGGALNGTVMLWDAATGDILQQQSFPIAFGLGAVNGIQFLPDSRRALLALGDDTLRLWDVVEWREVWSSPELQHDGGSVAISPDAKTLLSGGCSSRVLNGCAAAWLGLRDVATGKILRQFDGLATRVHAAAFSHDGKLVLAGDETGSIILWDAASGQELRGFEGFAGRIHSIAVSPDGLHVAASGETAGVSASVRLWNINTGAVAIEYPVSSTNTVYGLAFSPDKAALWMGTIEGDIQVWSVSQPEQLSVLRGHTSSIAALSFSPDGHTLLSASDDNTLRLWTAVSGAEQARFTEDQPVRTVAYSPDGQLVAVGFIDGSVVIRDAATGTEQRRISAFNDVVILLRFSSDSKYLAAARDSVRIWDVSSGEQVTELSVPGTLVTGLAYSPDSTRLAVLALTEGAFINGATNPQLQLWDTAANIPVYQAAVAIPLALSLAYSPDGSTMAVAGTLSLDTSQGTVLLLNATDGVEIRRFMVDEGGHTDAVYTATFSPDGQYLVSGAADASLLMWDVASGSLIRRFVGHTDLVPQALFLPDGQHMLSASWDHTIRLWDTVTGSEVLAYTGHADRVRDIALSPDGTQVLSGSTDATVRRWQIPDSAGEVAAWARSNRYVRGFTCEERLQYRIEPYCP